MRHSLRLVFCTALVAVLAASSSLAAGASSRGAVALDGVPKWTAAVPSVPGAPLTLLLGVSCLNANDCWAVGGRFRSSSSTSGPALIEHYGVHGWMPVNAAPSQRGTLDQLTGVSCLGADDCWAVGMRTGASPGNLFEHYGADGRWSRVAVSVAGGQLSSITCDKKSSRCWAVGMSSKLSRASIYELVGSRWHYVTPATLKATYFQLNGVACASSNDCLVVGYEVPGRGVGDALAERWNGHRWLQVRVPGQLAGGGSLEAVTCVPQAVPAQCWAVGQTEPKGSGLVPIHPLVELWNGHSFVAVASPPGTLGNYPELKAIACATATRCQAVGSRGSGEDDASDLAEGREGRSWTWEHAPSPLYGYQELTGIACPSVTDCWAVGEGENRSGSGVRMVVEHFSD